MEINTNIYPIISEDDFVIKSNLLTSGNYNINQKIDESIIFSCSTSRNAPFIYQTLLIRDVYNSYQKITNYKIDKIQQVFLKSRKWKNRGYWKTRHYKLFTVTAGGLLASASAERKLKRTLIAS